MGENEGLAKEKSKPIVSRRICQEDPFQNWGWYDPNSQGEASKESLTSLFNPTDWSS